MIKAKLARFSVKTAAAGAPIASASDVPFSNNSRASAAAVAELSKCLESTFDQVNYQDEPGDLLQLHLSRLTAEAAKYSNSSLDESQAEEWTCSPEASQLAHAACLCSNLVYKPLEHQDLGLVRVLERTPSLSGTNKAFSIWKIESSRSLVVSVRGTACAADHMVNLNAEAVDASSILGLPKDVLVHRGFLTCAKAIRSTVQEELAKQVALDQSISQIVFTGHSAGGAVSSLLFLGFAFNLPRQLSHATTSLMTFGSAPVATANIAPLVRKLAHVESVLAFVNEYDMVPRADTPYIRSMIDLYRSKYGMDRVKTDADGAPAKQEKPLPSDWPLPEPTLYPVGDVIISKSILQDPIVAANPNPTPRASITYKSFHISHEVFGNLLFCGLGVHKRKVYLERIRSICDVDSWSDSSTLTTIGSWHSADTD